MILDAVSAGLSDLLIGLAVSGVLFCFACGLGKLLKHFREIGEREARRDVERRARERGLL